MTPDEASKRIQVAIAGVGNCAASFIEGLCFYRQHPHLDTGLLFPVLCGYSARDIDVVAAFDIATQKKLVSPCVKPCINHRTTLCGLMIFVLTVKPMFFVAPLLMRNWKNCSRGGWFRSVVVHAGGQHSVHFARKFFLSDHT